MRRIRRAGRLALLLAIGLAGVVPPTAAHPYHLLIDNSVIGTAESVYDTRWVAQSFVPPTDFVLTRVALYVLDQGSSDTLLVTIRDCCISGLPGSTTLASGGVDGPAAPGWLDVEIAPTVGVAGGQTYWIVAHSLESNSNQAYDWWNSNDDSAYAPGTAASSSDGVSWSTAGKDYTFRVYGYAQPGFAFSASVSSPTVGPGQSATFRANFTNTGAGDAAGVWVNVTLPPELAYVGDDAAAIGGVRSGAYSFAFSNVAPGAYSFNLTAQAAGGVPDGTVVQAQVAFEGTDHFGAPLAAAGFSVPVTLQNARLALTLAASTLDVDPGDPVVLNATVTNVGAESAVAVLIEGTVDPNATYVSSAPGGTYDSFARTVRWNVPSIAPAAATSFLWTIRVPPGTADLATATSRARVAYEDLTGAPFPDETATRVTTVHAPLFAPALQLDRTTAERGQDVVATVDYDNAGSGTALGVWLNWSLGGHYALVSLTPAVPSTPTGAGFSIALASVAPGPHAISARLRVIRGLQDGLSMGVQVSVEATDGNGNPLASTPLAGTVELLAPVATLSLSVSNGTVRVGTRFDLNVTIQNTGRAAANGWLNLTVPAAVTYIADNGTYVVTAAPGSLSWRIPLIPAGARLHLGVTLRGDAAATASFRFVLNFTDAAGSPPATALSNAVSVEFVTGGGGGGGNGNGGSGGPPGGWLWWLGLLAVGFVVAALVVLIRKRVTIEEVFLVSHAGILLAHMSYALKHDRDRDLVSGMLTAVQDFIRDSFVPSLEGGLRSMDFGQRRILIRRGSASYLAIVLRGRTPSSLPKKMDETLRKFEAAFPQIADQVDGNMMDSAGEVLSRELLGR